MGLVSGILLGTIAIVATLGAFGLIYSAWDDAYGWDRRMRKSQKAHEKEAAAHHKWLGKHLGAGWLAEKTKQYMDRTGKYL